MNRANAFSSCHPLVNFLYFFLALAYAMFFMHPICLALSLLCAVAYAICLLGARAAGRRLLLLLPLLLLTALVNPLFNHQGATILAYLPSGNPLTEESLCYGLAAGTMLAAVICWFSCYNVVMTSDKFVYLFGRVIPALSLVLSMTLRFVPRFKSQLQVVANAQRCLGRDIGRGSLWQRAGQGLTILSIMITWALENAVDTADSMRARGYGLPGRTAFSLYRWDKRDSAALAFLLLCGSYVLTGKLCGGWSWQYFPILANAQGGLYSISLYVVYFALLIFPTALGIREDSRWTRLRSQI